MQRKKLAIQIAVLGCVLLAAGAASAQVLQAGMTVSHPTGFAVSRPLSEIAPALPISALPNLQTAIPLRPRPLAGGGALAPSVPDPALQTAIGALLEDDGHRKAHFPGVGANGSAPGDPNLAVGPNHIVQIVNTQFAVYNKNGTMFAGYPKTIGSLFSALGGGCASNFGDPIVQYDKAADRWLISQLGSFSAPYAECIAVSQSNDPTGAYSLYSFSFGSNLNDYPKIGVWPTATNSAYLATYNLFANGGPFVGAALCAYDRAAMLSGVASPAQICFTISNDGGFLPSDLAAPPCPPPARRATSLISRP